MTDTVPKADYDKLAAERDALQVRIREIITEAIRLKVSSVLTRERYDALAQNVRISIRNGDPFPLNDAPELDYLANRVVVELVAYIQGVPKREVRHEYMPANWWQAVRERWAPAWWLCRWPLKTRSIPVNITTWERVCPHLYSDPIRGPMEVHVAWLGDIGFPR